MLPLTSRSGTTAGTSQPSFTVPGALPIPMPGGSVAGILPHRSSSVTGALPPGLPVIASGVGSYASDSALAQGERVLPVLPGGVEGLACGVPLPVRSVATYAPTPATHPLQSWLRCPPPMRPRPMPAYAAATTRRRSQVGLGGLPAVADVKQPSCSCPTQCRVQPVFA